jgi:hypothetical protein
VHGVEGRNIQRCYIAGKPRPVAEELHKIFGGIPDGFSPPEPVLRDYTQAAFFLDVYSKMG